MQKRVGRTLQAEGKARTGAQDLKALGFAGRRGNHWGWLEDGVCWGRLGRQETRRGTRWVPSYIGGDQAVKG